MSNAIIRQEGIRPLVTDNLWEFRMGPLSFALGLLTGVASAGLVLRLTKRSVHQRTPVPKGWPANFAHRGGAAIVPENTIEGFQKATELGDVVLELDVRMCADGEVVVIHDDTVDRTTNGTGAVAYKTRADLQRLDAGYRFTTDGGTTFPWRGNGIHVPALEDVYQRFPQHLVVIELKGESPGTEEALWRTIESAGAQRRTLVASNGSNTIKRFRRISNGAVATAASVDEFALFWLLSLVKLHRMYNPPFQALQPPEVYKGIRIVTPTFIRKAHDSGLRVDVWTINEEADMQRLVNWSVDGIMTDRPDTLANVLNRNQAAPEIR